MMGNDETKTSRVLQGRFTKFDIKHDVLKVVNSSYKRLLHSELTYYTAY